MTLTETIDAFDKMVVDIQRHEIAVRMLIGWCAVLTIALIVMIGRGVRTMRGS